MVSVHWQSGVCTERVSAYPPGSKLGYRLTMRLVMALASVCATSACLNTTPLEPAPADLDGNLHWFWATGPAASDVELLDAVTKLGTASKAATRSKASPNRGELTPLASADLGAVMLEANDPAGAHGVFLLNVFDCTLDALETSLIALDQKAQRPDAFKAYTRVYSTDAEAYVARAVPRLAWGVDVTVELPFPISETYRSALKGDVRRVTSAAGPISTALVSRTWLAEPAVFEGNSTSTFTHDYQIEVFWERSSGEVFHAYGIWREMQLNSVNIGTDDPAYVNIMLDNLKKWDDESAVICTRP